MLKTFFTFVGIFSLLFLQACGGGGSSSGGNAAPAPVFQTGLYTGTETLTFAFNGEMVSDTGELRMTVTSTEVSFDYANLMARAPITANGDFNLPTGNFTYDTEDGDDIVCQASLLYSGKVTGSSATGTVSGNTNCDGISLATTGTFNITRSVAKSGSGLRTKTLRSKPW